MKWGGAGDLSLPTSNRLNREETSWHYLSMSSFQPSRSGLKPRETIGPKTNNIDRVRSRRYKCYKSFIPDLDVGVCLFGPIIPQDTTRLNREETSWHYVSMSSSQSSQCFLKP